MARVTVDDSLEKIPNRFELILVASKRARELSMTGQEPTVPWNNDKPTVVALREIAAGSIGMEILNVKPEIMAIEAFNFTIDKPIKRMDFADDFDADDSEEDLFEQQVIAAALVDSAKPADESVDYGFDDESDDVDK